MPTDFYINGEAMVSVKGGEQYSGNLVGNLTQLGLSVGDVTVSPRFVHKSLYCDDFLDVPADEQWRLADATIQMTLVFFNSDVLDICIKEAMAGGAGSTVAGRLGPAGTMMGGQRAIFASGNHFISLNIASPQASQPWRFPASHLAEQPVIWPLGTKRSLVQLNWKAIPYQVPSSVLLSGNILIPGEVLSSGAVLWYRTADT